MLIKYKPLNLERPPGGENCGVGDKIKVRGAQDCRVGHQIKVRGAYFIHSVRQVLKLKYWKMPKKK